MDLFIDVTVLALIFVLAMASDNSRARIRRLEQILRDHGIYDDGGLS